VTTANPVDKMPKKQSEGVFFANSALNIQRHIVKNTLLQTAFSAICPLSYTTLSILGY